MSRKKTERRKGGRDGWREERWMEGRTSLVLFQLIYTDRTIESTMFPVSFELAALRQIFSQELVFYIFNA